MAGAMLIVNAKDGECARYYTGNHWFDHMSGGCLFHPPEKMLAALPYLGLYKFS